jgi:hypothetical protein
VGKECEGGTRGACQVQFRLLLALIADVDSRIFGLADSSVDLAAAEYILRT